MHSTPLTLRTCAAPGALRALSASVVLACLHMGTAQAQTASEARAHATLPTVVVSGATRDQAVDDLPQSIDVIDAKTLGEQQSQTLRQALQDLPNASVRNAPARLAVGAASSAFARDGNTGINIRGIGGNRVLMTVDGVRMPRSYVSRSAIFDREYLSLELFKRVELLRGPASALYSSDGLAGVVNFVTFEPADFLATGPGQGSKTLGGRVAAGWSGDDDGASVAGTIAGKASDSVQWMLTATERRAHAMDTMGSNDAPNSLRTTANPQHDRNQALLGKIVLRPSAAQRHTFTLEHVGRRSDVELLSSRTPRPSAPGDVLNESSSYSGQRDRLAWDGRFGINAGWADHVRAIVAMQDADARRIGTSDLLSGTHRVRDNTYRERAWQFGLQADKIVRAGGWTHRIVYGVDHVRNRISNLYDGVAPLPPEQFPLKRFPDTRETTSALYVQNESVHGDWTVTPGLRLDHFAIDVTSQQGYYPPAAQPGQSLSKSAALPKLGVLYRASPTWSLFGQYSTGFRAPEPGQLNDHFEVIAAGTRVIIQPNPQLQPEKSRGLEIGARGRMERLNLDLTAFTNHYENLIVDAEFIQQVGNQRLFQAVNIARARIHGFELKGSYDMGVVAGGRMLGNFSYGMARGTNRSTGKPLNSVDPAQWTLGLKYDRAQWSLFADLRHHAAKKSVDIDSTAIMNARDGVQFAPPAATTLDVGGQWRLRKDLRLNVALRNLTNRKYWLWPDVYGQTASSAVKDAYTQPGRSAHVSLVLDF